MQLLCNCDKESKYIHIIINFISHEHIIYQAYEHIIHVSSLKAYAVELHV